MSFLSSAAGPQRQRRVSAVPATRKSLLRFSSLFLLCLLSLSSVSAQDTEADPTAEPTFKYVTSTMLSQVVVIFLIAVTAAVGVSCLSNIDVPEIYSNRPLDINKEY
ncbi:putative transmembrane protein [Toxoplasma gondii VAND]|uniref:Putative transmembrane protein n=1 Tax=Toxoplasma gondii VAND TaxID=933077 RepID=A0A086QKF8_TOXGO|nr:putative transmembrane protein [Toxoplasma gondii VAND]